MYVAEHRKELLPVWEEIEVLARNKSIDDIEDAIADPDDFIAQMSSNLEPVAKELLLAQVRPKVEPHLSSFGLLWEDVASVIRGIHLKDMTRATYVFQRIRMLELHDTGHVS